MPESLKLNGFDSDTRTATTLDLFSLLAKEQYSLTVVVREPLELFDHHLAHTLYVNPYDKTWLDQEKMGLEGYDGSYKDI